MKVNLSPAAAKHGNTQARTPCTITVWNQTDLPCIYQSFFPHFAGRPKVPISNYISQIDTAVGTDLWAHTPVHTLEGQRWHHNRHLPSGLGAPRPFDGSEAPPPGSAGCSDCMQTAGAHVSLSSATVPCTGQGWGVFGAGKNVNRKGQGISL